ncbi:MAG: hypothetical protein JO110_04230 [Acetobacteraceae bacterium]|nr:hypothetical protein [Acetobacteraceae bacterium]
MRRSRVLAIAAALLTTWSAVPSPAGAQIASGEIDPAAAKAIHNACSNDYQKRCSGTNPALAFQIACLRQYYVSLSPWCRAALQSLNSPSSGEQGSPDEDER